jgi:hypothetical protein
MQIIHLILPMMLEISMLSHFVTKKISVCFWVRIYLKCDLLSAIFFNINNNVNNQLVGAPGRRPL